MTELEWLSSSDPAMMIEWLTKIPKKFTHDYRLSPRLLRLFSCALCRTVWDLLVDERSRRAVEVGELYADSMVSDQERLDADDAAALVCEDFHGHAPWMARLCCGCAIASDASRNVSRLHTLLYADQYEARVIQADILRDIVGNPWKPAFVVERSGGYLWKKDGRRVSIGEYGKVVLVDKSWLTPDVKMMAQAVYDERAFDQMPILADALEESGCTNTDILDHLRGVKKWDCKTGCGQRHDLRCELTGASGWYVGNTPHWRGCWVVDLLLDKS